MATPVTGPLVVVPSVDEGVKQPEENATGEEPAPPEKPDADGLALTFAHGDDTSVITLRKKPLGFRFKVRKPIIVSFVYEGGHADSVGVKVGMEIVAFSGVSINEHSVKDVAPTREC